MIDQESDILEDVTTLLKNHFEDINIIGEFTEGLPEKYPCVYFYQSANIIDARYSTFDNLENVVTQEFTSEVFSNLSTNRNIQIKAVINDINQVMLKYGYLRIVNEPAETKDRTVSKRIIKFTNERLNGGE